MVYKDKEKEKENKKLWTEQNKEYLKERRRLYREKNKEKIACKVKEYSINNKEKILEYQKTEKCKKCIKISNWKKNGVISDDYDSLYDYYLNCKFCEECNIELITGNYGANKKCLDHNHETGEFRKVLCNTCNSWKYAERKPKKTEEQKKQEQQEYRNNNKKNQKIYNANRRFRDKLRAFILS